MEQTTGQQFSDIDWYHFRGQVTRAIMDGEEPSGVSVERLKDMAGWWEGEVERGGGKSRKAGPSECEEGGW